MAESFLKKLASTLTRFMVRCTCLGWRVASTPKTSTSPLSGRTSVEITRTSVLFPLPLGPRMPTTSPFPTESETESRASTTSPCRFLKLFSTPLSSNAFTTTPPIEASPGGAPALQTPPGLQPLPDDSPGLLALGGYRQLEEPARHPGPQGGLSGGPRVSPALGHLFGEVLFPGRPVLGPLLRSVVELEAHVLIATSRTSGRTSPPNTGIPMFVRRMCINPSVLCATTTWKTLYPPAENLSTISLNFSQCRLVSISTLQLVIFLYVRAACLVD